MRCIRCRDTGIADDFAAHSKRAIDCFLSLRVQDRLRVTNFLIYHIYYLEEKRPPPEQHLPQQLTGR
jgi:hypothetical protein